MLAAIPALATPAFATYAGSIVSSFYAEPITEPPWQYFPTALTYGAGYVWVGYAGNQVMTKRRPISGSVVSSFYLGDKHSCIAWKETGNLIFATASDFEYIFWASSTNGSVLGSFAAPPGTLFNALDYDDGNTGRPIWAAGNRALRFLWNLTSTGTIVSSFSLASLPAYADSLAYDGDTPGGPFLFVGLDSAPAMIYVLNPRNASIISSFVAPTANYAVCDISWDGRYLWILENPGFVGWVYRCVGHTVPAVVPASVGKIKALFR
ncbi:MAG TPA: hypothetical protein VMW93_00555 [bacterium]|nr:hypothetical protein [bacterium]